MACVIFAQHLAASPSAEVDRKPVIAVSILPQQYFAERIGSGRVEVLTLVGPGQSPHSYEPTPRQMALLSRSGVWVLSGTDFERTLTTKVQSQYPELTIIDGTAGAVFRSVEAHQHEEEGDGSHHESDTSALNLDRHTWLGRHNAKILAAHVRDALVLLDREGSSVYEKAYQETIDDIDATFDSLSRELMPMRGKTVFVFHPAFGYFLDEFGMSQEAVETGGKEPTPKTLSALIAKARSEGITVIFVQKQFPVSAARELATSVGATVVPLDALASNWLENIRYMGASIAQSLASPARP